MTATPLLILSLSLLLIQLNFGLSFFIFPSNQPSFSNQEKFININNIIFKEGDDEDVLNPPKRINSLADMDNDKHVDLVGENGNLWQWNSDDWKFQLKGNTQSNVGVDCPDCHIIAADMNFDGFNDLLVQRKEGDHDVVECFLFNKEVFERNAERRYNSIGIVANLTTGHQFSIFDHNSDMLIDIMGIDQSGVLSVWNNQGVQADVSGVEHLTFKKVSLSTFSGRSVVTPFVPIFADVDGDCNADIVLLTCNDKRGGFTSMSTCQKPVIEFYINYMGSYQYMPTKDILAPRGIGRISVGDMNRDGNMDLVFPVCYPNPTCDDQNEIHIMYNEQIPMCTTIWFSGSNCRKQTDLCTQEKWTFGNLIDHVGMGYDRSLLSDDSQPPTVRIADWNMDGYPDLALTFTYRSKPGISKVEIWNNVQCNENLCEKTNDGAGWTESNRTFEVQEAGMDEVNELNFARAAFFMDLDETGTLDLFVISSQLDGVGNKSMVTGFFNNFHPDAFFFKTMGLNGVTTNGGFGAIVPGFTFKFDIPINDVTSGKLPRVGSQFTSSSYLSLQPPYSFFGLGRENGYIENFFMGAPVTDGIGTKYVKHEPGIIPNSQLICIPKPLESPSQWELQLFVSPTAQSIWVALGVLLTLIMFGIPIIVCWIAERRRDFKTRQRSQAMRTFL
mmetsp:Transcript_302/g.1064  ORF Transcript_302/g.1064 Transcript_302/m.1064 type:complete len:671 (-) Transcript_302:63-2075(-)